MFEPKKVDIGLIDKSNPLYRKKFFFNRDIMIADIDLTRAVFNRLAELGAKSVNYVNNCDFYVGELDNAEEYKCNVISMEKLLEMIGEVEIFKYDDKAILEQYMAEKEAKRKLDRIAKINESNKKNI